MLVIVRAYAQEWGYKGGKGVYSFVDQNLVIKLSKDESARYS
jgi:hypothetical protein